MSGRGQTNTAALFPSDFAVLVDQLDFEPVRLHVARNHILRVKIRLDLLEIDAVPRQLPRGKSRNHVQVSGPAQGTDDFLGHELAERGS